MSTRSKRILIVEDEQAMQWTLRTALVGSSYHVYVAKTGKDALELTRLQEPDLILLDLNLPGIIQGLDVCREVRQWTQIPIIIISALEEEKKKVEALDLGADDYLTKPFGTAELLARVRVCLRRSSASAEESEQLPDVLTSEDGYLSVDVLRHYVRAGNQDVRLTPTEFDLLYQLMRSAGKVLTHRSLLQAVWGPEYGEEADYLRVYIRQLRRKVEVEPSRPRYILTEPGVGYVFRAGPLTASGGDIASHPAKNGLSSGGDEEF
jgi:two-component system KDP operon response regulator KdpE